MLTTKYYQVLLNKMAKHYLSTSKCIFTYYQGESTIFDKGNFLFHTPYSNNLLNLKELYFHTLLWVDQKREHTQRIFQCQTKNLFHGQFIGGKLLLIILVRWSPLVHSWFYFMPFWTVECISILTYIITHLMLRG